MQCLLCTMTICDPTLTMGAQAGVAAASLQPEEGTMEGLKFVAQGASAGGQICNLEFPAAEESYILSATLQMFPSYKKHLSQKKTNCHCLILLDTGDLWRGQVTV